jgi:hypothetical protein
LVEQLVSLTQFVSGAQQELAMHIEQVVVPCADEHKEVTGLVVHTRVPDQEQPLTRQ